MWYVRGCGEEGVVDEVVVCKRSVVKLKTNESGDVYRGNACSVWGGMFRNRKKKSYFQRNSCVCVVLFCFVFFFCLVKCRALPQPERRCHPRRILRLDADDHHVGADATGLG